MRMRWAENEGTNGTLMVHLEERDSKLFRNTDNFRHCESLAWTE